MEDRMSMGRYESSINALTDDDWGMARELVKTLRSKE
jgi:hypothetical protein